MIEIKGLHKFFNKGRPNEIHVINDVSLTLPEKGMVAIFGKSGCGKTTLLNVIGGLDGFSEGSLTVEGMNIRKSTDDIRNRYIGYIFQNYNLTKSETCFDNVAAALRLCGMTDEEEIKRRVSASLRNVGMENYAARLPDSLSGGQQQRIAIARAIVKNPRIILADEPTGNLDELNTVKIMDLLKEISREHLVILVTHEANLVDYYCDTVIELSDGKVAGTKNNELAYGFVARDKNDIYLGELEKSELSDENAHVEYYGDRPDEKVNLKIINANGKIYVQIGTEKVHILDETSEIRVREGIYEEKGGKKEKSENSLDMSALPRVQATKTGSLFTLKSSLKSGYRANFGKDNKKGKRLLKRFMALFASVIVFISAMFGTAFRDMAEADGAYNHNVFYLYMPDETVSRAVTEAVGSEDAAIDYARLVNGYPRGDSSVSFRAGSFETFVQYDFSTVFGTNAVYLDASLAKELPLVEGKKEALRTDEIIITSRVAEALVEKSTLGYINEPRDLLGLVSVTYVAGVNQLRIAGIVESDETAIYLNELTMADYVHYTVRPSFTALASRYGITLGEGEAVLAVRYGRTDVEYPSENEKIKIQGKEFTVTQVKIASFEYSKWLTLNGINKDSEYTYFSSIVKTEQPGIAEGSQEFTEAVERVKSERLFEYYDYYYSQTEDFYRDLFFFEPYNLEVWLYLEKGIEKAKFVNLPEEYYKAHVYKELNGRYPTKAELETAYNTLPTVYEEIKSLYTLYEKEFYSNISGSGFNSDVYLISEKDFITLSKQTGETHPSAKTSENDEYVYDDEGNVSLIRSGALYTLIHSTNPQKTERWLKESFPELTVSKSNRLPIITPGDIRNGIIESSADRITSNLIAMAVIIAMSSACMYFIMHASVMNRIKEVGIYRAIGVSRKNLIFKFFTEAALLTALTVLIGYLISSAIIGILLGGSSLMAEIFYYPVWLALAVLGIIASVTLFFGTLPIILLLRKTPSSILAKYDI